MHAHSNAPLTAAARAELADLHTRITELERELRDSGLSGERAREAALQKVIAQTWNTQAPYKSAHSASSPTFAPEEHDTRLKGLTGILEEYGVSAAIKAAEKQQSPHLVDEFHRVLLDYVRKGLPR
jgi:hypothetical protein